MALTLGINLSVGRASTDISVPLLVGEQDVIDLAPSFWVDASYANAVKSVDSGSEANATDGQDVNKWVSRVGSGVELAQSTASKRPIFNSSNSDFGDYSTITFDHTADTALFQNASYLGSSGTGGTIFYVAKELGGDANSRIISWGVGNNSNLGHNYSNVAFYVYKPLIGYGGSGSANTIELSPYMAAIVLDGSSSYFTINEGTDVTFSMDSGNSFPSVNPITSVGGYNGATENSSTVAAEYILFDSALSASDVAKVENYLNNKYTGGSGF